MKLNETEFDIDFSSSFSFKQYCQDLALSFNETELL